MKYFSSKQNKRFKKGFTLIELLVATGVFLVVMTISLGSVVSVLSAGRKSKTLSSIMTNLNFTMEIMSREIKFGKTYFCGTDSSSPHTATQDCGSTPENSFTFTTNEGVDTIYRLNTTNNQIERSTNSGVSFVGLTSREIHIDELKFYVFDSTPFALGDSNQPRVLMFVRGYAGNKPDSRSNFILQTLISQRSLDI